MNKLKDILYKSSCVSMKGNTDLRIDYLSFNSRDIKKNTLFIAVVGTVVDGHTYIDDAVKNGAVAVVCETFPEKLFEDVTYISVKDSKDALGIIASNFYDNPSAKLKLIGVTGTNGKTTTTTLLHQLFLDLGYASGLISTICIAVNNVKRNTTHTTPDPITLNKVLDEMVKENIEYCFMEVSSHAVVLKRISGLTFVGGAFTNISHDHLDFHITFAEYIQAKKMFFDGLPKDAFALSNIDDANGEFMLQNTQAKKFFYGIKKMADFKCKINESHFSGINLYINQHNAWFKLVGHFNAYNILLAYAIASILGKEDNDVLSALSNLEPVEGRFEHFKAANNVVGIIDYAHTPDALKNVLTTINSIRTGNEKLITVVGCGGNRDALKRPLMAQIAAQLSNTVILTSDNPRFEDPDAILDEMIAGVDVVSKKNMLRITNRKEAIKTACHIAQPNDIVLVAGKGHEKYQEIKGEKHPFDDTAFLKEFLNIKIQ